MYAQFIVCIGMTKTTEDRRHKKTHVFQMAETKKKPNMLTFPWCFQFVRILQKKMQNNPTLIRKTHKERQQTDPKETYPNKTTTTTNAEYCIYM